MLSIEERQVGVASMDKSGRVGFPQRISVEGRPLAQAVGTLEQGTALAVISDISGRRRLSIIGADGVSHTQRLNEEFRANPASLAWHDVNQDGKQDLVVLIPYERIKILLQVDDDAFEEIDLSPVSYTHLTLPTNREV